MGNLKNTCWDLFNQTGEINYYLLYKALEEDKDTCGTDKV